MSFLHLENLTPKKSQISTRVKEIDPALEYSNS